MQPETMPLQAESSFQEDVEHGDIDFHRDLAKWRRTRMISLVTIASIALLAGPMAYARFVSGNGNLKGVRTVESLVMMQETKYFPDTYFQGWSDEHGLEGNLVSAFTHFIHVSRFDEELTEDETRDYDSRYRERCFELIKDEGFMSTLNTFDPGLVHLRHQSWARITRQALEDEKPEVTDELVLAVNSQHLGFTIQKNDASANVSWRQVQNTLGSKPPTEMHFDQPEHVDARRLSELPHEFDGRNKWPLCKDVIDRAHNQGQCGSCWAFAALSVLDSRLCIHTAGEFSGPKAMLSRTYATSCVASISDGCQGGWPTQAFNLIAQHGTPLGGNEGCIPYFGHGAGRDHFDKQSVAPACPSECKPGYGRGMSEDMFSFGAPGGAHQYRFTDAGTKAAVMQQMMTQGPVSGAVHVSQAFFAYAEGIYNQGCNNGPNHAVALVGWGNTPNFFWTLVNSWGAESFGQMKVAACVIQVYIIPAKMNSPPRSVPSPLFPGGSSPSTDDNQQRPSTDDNSGGSDGIYKPFSITSGECGLTKEGCITSPNFPQPYGSNEHCEIAVATKSGDGGVVLNVEAFDTEGGYDWLSVDNNKYSGNGSPELAKATKKISFNSDGSVSRSGWQICASQFTHPDPAKIYHATCKDTGDKIAEKHGTKLHIKCPPNCVGYIWGNDIYTRDSHVCAAGVHVTGGQEFKLEFLNGKLPPAPKTYPSTYRNKVHSLAFARGWAEAFSVSKI